jgi:hypothetical protein
MEAQSFSLAQGIGLRPQMPWAGFSRPDGPQSARAYCAKQIGLDDPQVKPASSLEGKGHLVAAHYTRRGWIFYGFSGFATHPRERRRVAERLLSFRLPSAALYLDSERVSTFQQLARLNRRPGSVALFAERNASGERTRAALATTAIQAATGFLAAATGSGPAGKICTVGSGRGSGLRESGAPNQAPGAGDD